MNVIDVMMAKQLAGGSGGGGGGGGVLVVHATDNGGFLVLDKTWKEITQASYAVLVVNMQGMGNLYKPLSQTNDDGEGQYSAFFYDYLYGESSEFYTDNENGYPAEEGAPK